MSEKNTGRVTIPTNLDVVPETIELMKRWGADAIRDCDGQRPGQRFMQLTTPREKIMSGRRQTRMRCSSVIL